MIKIINWCLLAFAISIFFVGCIPSGALYSNIVIPYQIENGVESTKEGKAECLSVLGLVATGDCGIEAAKRNGNISEVSVVDIRYNNILFFFTKTTTIVRGE